ncbi:hypothetical protein Dimus_015335 [Dionaea muscipula]
MDGVVVPKQELPEHSMDNSQKNITLQSPVIEISSSDSIFGSSSSGNNDSDSEATSLGKRRSLSDFDEEIVEGLAKKPKLESENGVVLPVGFLEPLSPEHYPVFLETECVSGGDGGATNPLASVKSCKQFWKAGDYDVDDGIATGCSDNNSLSASMDHVRVHPRFLHSNATSHKWALGAFAELLDNALDEACNGATYVNVDMLVNKKDKTKMVLVQDNGGGMSPDRMRQCISLGYSAKSKCASTIGQYGNGFKTSTMRLGADVIVFSCCKGQDGMWPTRSIGLLSYTFLRSTGKEDIVVPMIDYEKKGHDWTKIIRLTPEDWQRNLETIVHWSPYSSIEELLDQFDFVKGQGTRIIIYNLWEDDVGQQELDFDTDKHDIQIRGNNRDEKNIKMAKQYPNSRHFLTYRHSLRSYASILYLRLTPAFRIILRGKDVDHHNLLNDMVHVMKVTYRPAPLEHAAPVDMVADVTLGFVKDAVDHIDVQGFNVYHKNRLIKPFWRVWNAAGSDGRGVIGVLEANFVAPAHDKQGFERTIALSRLEARLLHFQKNYWRTNCDKIGYAPRRKSKKSVSPVKTLTPPRKGKPKSLHQNGHVDKKKLSKGNSTDKNRRTGNKEACNGKSYKRFDNDSSSTEHLGEDDTTRNNNTNSESMGMIMKSEKIHEDVNQNNNKLNKRLHALDGLSVEELLQDLQFERERSKSLEAQLQKAERKLCDQIQSYEQKLKEMDKEQEALIEIFAEERDRRDTEEENLRNRLQSASTTIEELVDKVKALEKMIQIRKTEK